MSFRPIKANSRGQTPLHYAAEKGHTEVVNVLLRHQARIKAEISEKTVKQPEPSVASAALGDGASYTQVVLAAAEKVPKTEPTPGKQSELDVTPKSHIKK